MLEYKEIRPSQSLITKKNIVILFTQTKHLYFITTLTYLHSTMWIHTREKQLQFKGSKVQKF